MNAIKTERGFTRVLHEKYQNMPGEMTVLIQESSAIGDYDDALNNPGSSFLWVGEDHHLNREEVAELITRMQHWLDTKRLKVDTPPAPDGPSPGAVRPDSDEGQTPEGRSKTPFDGEGP